MKYNIALVDEFGCDGLVMNALDCVMKAGIFFEMPNILDAAGRKIIDNKYFVSALQISIAQMRTNKSGAAGD